MSFFGAKVIVFEGIDGSGKSTQIKVLSRFFDKLGIKYYCTREPGGSPMAEKIRKLFLSHEKLDIYTQIFLCCAARKEHLLYLAELQQKENFDFIIFDRFIDSTFAYQIYPNNISEHFLFNINKASQLNIEVDCEFILHVNLELLATRRRKSRDHFDENFELLKKVQDAYLKIHEKHKRKILIESDIRVNATHAKIMRHLERKFPFLRKR